MSKQFLRRLAVSAVCSATALLSACGGGSSNPALYSIGGKLSGLASDASVVVQDNAGNNTTLSANGTFGFLTQVASGMAYAVTVLTQPTGQTCTVTSGSGTVSGANVTNVLIACTVNTYAISGTVSGLNTGAQVTVQDNGGDPTAVKANGAFSFATKVLYNGSYAVTVAVQPPAQACTVSGGSGSKVTAAVSGVGVACVAATEAVIHTFDVNADGIGPNANVIQGSDGNFYGTTYTGGTSGLGTVFKITPAGTETVLHSFIGGATDGSFPAAALIQGTDGNFYGTTANGGPNGNGTVYKITPAGIETVLYTFTGGDGGGPFGALVQGSDGNFYGTTSGGGSHFNGTVFKITPAGLETTLYSFVGGPSDGGGSQAGLIQGSDGNFYGTTLGGGSHLNGTVFKITPAGVETLLYSFAGAAADGSEPSAPLIQGSDGNFYGTTYGGGASNLGTVFKITPAGVETPLHSFAGGAADGNGPMAPLIQGSDGNFYGTTYGGGASNLGTVFKIAAGVESVVHSFAGGTDGSSPAGALIQGTDGNFYGTTYGGGTSRSGSLIKITPAGIESVAYSFNSGSEGQSPAGLIQGSDGNFYGTTQYGGTSNFGTLFKVTPAGVETTLYSFVGGASDGGNPVSVIQGSDGNFYGTTSEGGTSGSGAVFKITPAGAETLLHSFAGGTSDGRNPVSLIQGSDGNLYGTTSGGGTSSSGTVFKITSAGVETPLHSFAGGTTDGGGPVSLIQASDGNFYGTTTGGGTGNFGTVFKITAAGVETVLYSFAGGTSDGGGPVSLIQASDGNFYGTTTGGGTGNFGTVFKITAAGVETVLYSFAGGVGDGRSPVSLIQCNDGNFYGISSIGGGGGGANGTLFKVTPAGVETVLNFFGGGDDGSVPSAMILGSDGYFYGITSRGGTSNLGTLFRF